MLPFLYERNLTMATGTKETKEALIALIAISEFLTERLADGAGLDDVAAVYSKLTSDDVFVKKIKIGFEGLDKIQEELKDLTTEEVTVLGYEVAPLIVSLLLKIKNKKKS